MPFESATLRLSAVAALLVLIVGAAALIAALAIEHVWNYVPCALCLEQRWPYYLGLPIAAATAAAALTGASRIIVVGGLVAVAALFAYGAGLGVYHAGIESDFWEGPAACAAGAGGLPSSAGDLLSTLSRSQIVPCDRAALTILGLSLAGWNAIVSAVLALTALAGAAIARGYGSSSQSQ